MARNLREHILQTASELFYRQGIKDTGIDTIVKEAGIAKMSLYKYFPSKDDLVLAYLQGKSQLLRERLLRGMEDNEKLPKDKLLAVFETFEEILASPAFRGCPFINASAEFAAEANPVQRASAEFYQSFCAMLSAQARLAGIKEADELAMQLAILISGAVVREQMQRHSAAMRTAYAAAEILIEKYLPQAESL